ncbi:MAG: response regulator transcription factor [Phycisphaerales bacterium]
MSELGLTPRAADVVQLLSMGTQEQEVARHLGLSVHTIHWHVKRIYAKLDVHDRAELLLRVLPVISRDGSQPPEQGVDTSDGSEDHERLGLR